MPSDAKVEVFHTVENLALIWMVDCVLIDSLLNFEKLPFFGKDLAGLFLINKNT